MYDLADVYRALAWSILSLTVSMCPVLSVECVLFQCGCTILVLISVFSLSVYHFPSGLQHFSFPFLFHMSYTFTFRSKMLLYNLNYYPHCRMQHGRCFHVAHNMHDWPHTCWKTHEVERSKTRSYSWLGKIYCCSPVMFYGKLWSNVTLSFYLKLLFSLNLPNKDGDNDNDVKSLYVL